MPGWFMWVPVMQDELKLAARVHYSFLPEHYKDDRLESHTTFCV